MSIVLANNAMAHIAATVSTTDTSIVLNTAEVGNFPSPSAGNWFPMTLVSAAGVVEIVKVTARSANILTAVRAQEGTTAAAFAAGDRAEIRMTAAVVETLQADTAALAAAVDTKDAAVLSSATAMDAALSATLTASMNSADTALHTTVTGEIATAKAQAQAYSDAALAAAVTALAEPVGAIKMWLLTTAPSGWQFCFGQALSRSTNAALFAAIGTTYGAGDGSTTFNLPDLRGRVPAGRDDMGGTAANRLTTGGSGVDGATLGAAGGAENVTLTAAQLAAHAHTASTTITTASAGTPAGSISSDGGHNHSLAAGQFANAVGSAGFFARGNSGAAGSVPTLTTDGVHNHTFTGSALAAHGHTASTTVNNSTGGGGAHNNVQPSLVVNFIIKT